MFKVDIQVTFFCEQFLRDSAVVPVTEGLDVERDETTLKGFPGSVIFYRNAAETLSARRGDIQGNRS